MRKSKIINRLTALSMLVMLLVTSLIAGNGEALAAELGQVAGIDYNRVNVSEMSGGFPATFSCGGVKITGKLRYSGKLDVLTVDKYIEQFMDEHDIDEDDLLEAEEVIRAYKYLDEVTDADKETFLGRVASIAGYGTETTVAIDVGKQILNENFELSEEAWANTLSNFSSPAMAANTVLSFIVGKIAKNNPYVKVFMTIKDGIIASFQAYEDSQERWDIRIEGMAAIRALDEFYKRLNNYIDVQAVKDKAYPADAVWTLQINGQNDRMFSFMGIPANIQTWRVGINMTKEVNYSSYGGPAGGYCGPMEIELTHDMTPFSNWVFDIRVGSLKPMWYSKAKALTFKGQHVYDCSQSGKIEIYRFLCNSNAKMDIYSDRVTGATLTNSTGRVMATIFLQNFDSSQYVASTKKAFITTTAGFFSTNGALAGYAAVDAAFHVEGGYDDSMSIIMDKGYADTNLLNSIRYKTNVYSQTLATFWDRNIWAPLDAGKVSINIKLK